MFLTVIKVIALLFALLVTIKSYLAYRQHQESLVMFLFWTVTWLAIITFAFFPQLIDLVLGQQNVGVGSFIGVALVFVYFVVYRVYVKADRIEKRFNDIVRQGALKGIPPKKSRQK